MTDKTKSLARWMTVGFWVLFIAILTVFFNDQLDRLQNPNRNITFDAINNTSESRLNNKANAVKLIRNRNGHYVAGGLINGKKVVFIIDTGASDVSIPSHVARRLNLTPGTPILYQTANGSVTGYRTVLNEIQLGNIIINNVRGGINPGMKGDYILLGMTFLKQIEFTQRGNELILRKYLQ